MNTETIAMVIAGFGVIGSIVWVVMGWIGIRTLQDVRDRLGRR